MRNQAYYEVVAQLLPLLFITVIIEYRLLRQPALTLRFKVLEGASAVFVALTCLAIAVTEGEVLWALKSASPDPRVDDDLRPALILTAVALLAPVVIRAVTSQSGLSRGKRALSVGLGLLVALVLWVSTGLLTR